MSVVLQVGDRAVKAEELLPLLRQYQLLPKLVRELVIENAIADVECTDDEVMAACKQLYEHNQITSDEQWQAWLEERQLTPESMQALAVRPLKLRKFKSATWGNKVESHFLQRKAYLDRVTYSLLRVKEAGVAQELFFRIQAKETTFNEVARLYSQGPEAQTGGLIGPVELSVPHPVLAKLLLSAQPGQLLPPARVGEWVVVVRLEKFLPCQLDAAMEQRMLDELFESWLKAQIEAALATHDRPPTSEPTATDPAPAIAAESTPKR